jgi:CubicO group peptidase (beta-lactamase class C family)
MQRRLFLQHALAAPFLSRNWKSGVPGAYLEEITLLMRAAPVPGAVFGALKGFEPAWIVPVGVRESGGNERITSRTLFQAASLTKQVTAYAALALWAQQRLDLDRPLVSWVDDLRDPVARTVTPRHVLSHSSGFRNWRFAQPGKPDPELVPEFVPGSRYSYSGEGYFYLQRVMEQITGHGFGRVVRDLVFEPLRMTSTTLVWDPRTLMQTALPHDRRGKVREGWDKRPRSVHDWAERKGTHVDELRYEEYSAATRDARNPVLPDWMLPNGAASMVTNAEDYMRFLAGALRNPEIAKEQVRINEFLGWGQGWAIERAAGHTYVWQWGENPGFRNLILAEPSSGSAVFIFTNSDAGVRVYDRVVTHATGHDHPALFWL